MADSVLREIQASFLECSICMSDYNDAERSPILLQCQHNLCLSCLRLNCRNQELICPFCKTPYPAPNGDISGFDKDRTRVELLELITKFENESKSCVECYGRDKNFSHCAKCKHYVCSKGCATIHEDSCELRVNLSATDSIVCHRKGHDEGRLKYYCISKQCREAVCATCVFEFHRDDVHTVKMLFQFYKDRRSEVAMLSRALKDKTVGTQEVMNEIQIALRDVVSLKKEIESIMTANENFSDEEKRALKKKVDIAGTKIQQELKCIRQKYGEYIQNASECIKTMKSSCSGDVLHFLADEGILCQKADEFINMNCTFNVEVDTSLYELKLLRTDAEGSGSKSQQFMNIWRNVYSKMTRKETKAKKIIDRKGAVQIVKKEEKKISWIPTGLFIILFCVACNSLDSLEHYIPNIGYTINFESSRHQKGCFLPHQGTFSTEPFFEGAQVCGLRNNLYIYHGSFVNTSYNFSLPKCLRFSLDIRALVFHQVVSKYPILEFGVATGTVNARHMKNQKYNESWGWQFEHNFDELIFSSFAGSTPDKSFEIGSGDLAQQKKYKMCFHRNSSMTLSDLSSRNFIGSHSFPRKSLALYPVFKLADEWYYDLQISLLSNNVSFNRSSTHSDLELSEDGKSLRSSAAKNMRRGYRQTVRQSYGYTNEIECLEECVIPVHVDIKSVTSSLHGTVGILTGDVQTFRPWGRKFLRHHIPLFHLIECPSSKGSDESNPFCSIKGDDKNGTTFFVKSTEGEVKVILIINASKKKIYARIGNQIEHVISVPEKFQGQAQPFRLYIQAPETNSIVLYLGGKYYLGEALRFHFYQFSKILTIIMAGFAILEIVVAAFRNAPLSEIGTEIQSFTQRRRVKYIRRHR